MELEDYAALDKLIKSAQEGDSGHQQEDAGTSVVLLKFDFVFFVLLFSTDQYIYIYIYTYVQIHVQYLTYTSTFFMELSLSLLFFSKNTIDQNDLFWILFSTIKYIYIYMFNILHIYQLSSWNTFSLLFFSTFFFLKNTYTAWEEKDRRMRKTLQRLESDQRKGTTHVGGDDDV